MKQIIGSFFSTLALSCVIASASPSTAVAQSCIWACVCEGLACSCHRSTTGGESCTIGSNGCAVQFCDSPAFGFFVTPTGSVVTDPFQFPAATAEAVAHTVDGGETYAAEPRIGWVTVASGVSVLVDCHGFVSRRFIDPGLAVTYRKRSVELVL